ncbi:hypothetical protein AB0M02_33500 [Actinoplanes sp. NPDC051861]|uniref:hypothetical protein n=1 Tax=Actinoplanes sp. NPDC051861 TaxID=3155170 RepID=UPI003426C5ED
MRRSLARISALLLVSAAAVGVPSAAVGQVDDPYVFTSADVGFIDGGEQAGRPGRVVAMDDYLPDRKPIVRLDLSWDQIQPDEDVAPEWSRLDAHVDAAHARGMRVLLILDYTPAWANGGNTPNHYPVGDAAWETIVGQAVDHFGAKVQAYEVWNEPNNIRYAHYGDDSIETRMRRYWKLADLAYGVIKDRCEQCVVLAGASGGGDAYEVNGVIYNDNEARDWLEWAYRQTPRPRFDALTYHPYPDWGGGNLPSYAKDPCHGTTSWYRYWSGFGPDDPACGGLAGLRDVMVRNGEGDKKIWATEFGFPSDGWRAPQSMERVRDALEEGVRMWRSRPYTGPLFLYSFQDTEAGHEECRDKPHNGECHFGLRDNQNRPKEPMYSDLREVLDGENWLPALAPGRSLFRGAAMRSANGRYTLRMQADGNLVLTDPLGSQIRVQGDRRAYRLSNQHDGNLVLYDHADRVLWATSTSGRGDSTLTLTDDGALVLRPSGQTEPTWDSSDLFASGVEVYQAGNDWNNTISVDAPGGGIRNVTGVCCSLTGPELYNGTNPAGAHTGGRVLMYSGRDTSGTDGSHAYNKVFRFGDMTVTSTTRLSYWIYPESTQPHSTCVSVDLILATAAGARNSLRDTGVTDQRGNRAHPAHQCGKLTPGTWNFVSVPVGAVAAGKKIVQLDIGYDQPANKGGYRGFIDDIRITR